MPAWICDMGSSLQAAERSQEDTDSLAEACGPGQVSPLAAAHRAPAVPLAMQAGQAGAAEAPPGRPRCGQDPAGQEGPGVPRGRAAAHPGAGPRRAVRLPTGPPGKGFTLPGADACSLAQQAQHSCRIASSQMLVPRMMQADSPTRSSRNTSLQALEQADCRNVQGCSIPLASQQCESLGSRSHF